MTEISELFKDDPKPTDPVEVHFMEYRKMGERVHITNVVDAARVWAEWQEVTARLLLLTGKNREYAEWKLEDARQRRAELPKIVERSKKKR